MRNSEFDSILGIDGRPPSQGVVYPKRLRRIEEAISWETATEEEISREEKRYTILWEDDEYSIKLGKPGKEALLGYSGELNINDMRPDIFRGDNIITKAATFGDIVDDLEKVAKKNSYCVELLGSLLFRAALLLDHKEIKLESGENVIRYFPNKEVVSFIEETIPEIYDIPPHVFLHYLDAIALNEDVKYFSKKRDLSRNNIGGKNNLLSYVKVIAVITGKLGLSSIAGPLFRSGVAAISIQDALSSMPHLKKD